MSAIKILTNWFNRVELPFGFKELYENSPNAILVTQTRSIVLKAFLNSVAERTGWDGTNYLNNSNLEILENALNWTSFTELSSWEATTKEAEGLEFIPLSIFNLRGPLKRLPKHKLGFLDVIFLLCGHSVNSYILGNKLRIDKFDPFSKLRLERKLKVEFYKNQKVVRGTPFETIDTQSRTVLSGVNYQKEISVVSKRLGVSEKKLEKKAQKVFFEIAANPKAIIFRIAALLTRPLLSHLFSDIITKGTEHIAPTVRDNAAVMIPMHRSHFDYMIISSEIYDSRLNTPLTAAGVNLSFWPFGFFIRSLGGYFVKRDVKDRIYNIVLKRYISYLIKRGHLQKFYIEGGRSRTGKMRRPKIGLLSMFVEAYSRGLRKDIAFIPVSLTYENVVEDSAYGTENTGSAKVKENWKSLLRASKILRNHYGEVILRFAEPIKISSILDKENLKKPEDIRKQTTKLAYLITDRIRLSSDISFTALAFTALMSSSHYGLKLSELENSVIELSKLAAVMKALNPAIGDLTPSLEKFLNGNKELILDLPRTGIAKLGEYAGTPVISIPGDRRFTADFYRNATSHLFLPAAILAASELINGEILLKDISMFRTCFALEYLLPENDEFLSTIEQLINYLLKVEILAKVENKLYFKTRAPGMFNPRLILGSIQSMLYVFDSLRERQSKQSEWPLKELIKNLHDEFKAASYIAKFNRTEASAKSSIESALDSLRQIGIISIKEDDKNGKLVGISNDQAEELVFLINANKAILDYR